MDINSGLKRKLLQFTDPVLNILKKPPTVDRLSKDLQDSFEHFYGYSYKNTVVHRTGDEHSFDAEGVDDTVCELHTHPPHSVNKWFSLDDYLFYSHRETPIIAIGHQDQITFYVNKGIDNTGTPKGFMTKMLLRYLEAHPEIQTGWREGDKFSYLTQSLAQDRTPEERLLLYLDIHEFIKQQPEVDVLELNVQKDHRVLENVLADPQELLSS